MTQSSQSDHSPKRINPHNFPVDPRLPSPFLTWQEYAVDRALSVLQGIRVVLQYFGEAERLVLEHAHYENKLKFPDFYAILADFSKAEIECKDRSPKWLNYSSDVRRWTKKNWGLWTDYSRKDYIQQRKAERILVIRDITSLQDRLDEPNVAPRRFLKKVNIVEVGFQVTRENWTEATRGLIQTLGDLFKDLMTNHEKGVYEINFINPRRPTR